MVTKKKSKEPEMQEGYFSNFTVAEAPKDIDFERAHMMSKFVNLINALKHHGKGIMLKTTLSALGYPKTQEAFLKLKPSIVAACACSEIRLGVKRDTENPDVVWLKHMGFRELPPWKKKYKKQ